jgi:acyl carrier protein
MSQPSPPASAAHDLVVAALLEVAPELDAGTLDPHAHLQRDLGLDSMDYLDLIGAISEFTGIEIPEADYAQLASVATCADYVVAHGGGS